MSKLLISGLYYYRLYSVLQWKRSRSVFILSVIFSYSGNGLVQCLYYYRLYSVLQWKRSRSVFILLSVIFSYSGNGLVQCSVGGS